MSWIKTIDYQDANNKLRKIYDKVKGPDDNVDNVLLIHSLRPHTLIGHMTLYKSVIHSSNNTLDKWYLEALGVFVSHLNQCSYCVQHHYEGFKRIYEDKVEATKFWDALQQDNLHLMFDKKEQAGFVYARKLTRAHHEITEADIHNLRVADFSDGEILEVNQLVSYFNYVNRMVVGLGVNTDGDILGLSPNDSDDPNNWNHA